MPVEVEIDQTLALSERRSHFQSQQSTVASRRQQAVCVRRAYKHYGTKKMRHIVLEGLNMTVSKGAIYGLLGASGCGKTTLLSCIVGRRKLNSGDIWVLGGKPGSKGSGVPGPRIGYMPQELSLYVEFTIRETFLYFGWVNGMTTEEIDEKIHFLLKFLQLPSANRFVKTLSGGQQRRVSLAAALVHSPELLILDEPTVGVDPVLRQNIWEYLIDLSKTKKTTIIITTHYIDETRQANMIGLMRGGKFLAEQPPEDLLAAHMCDTLEDVFLKLSKLQNQGKRRRSSYMLEVMGPPTPEETEPDLPPEEGGKWGLMDYLKFLSIHRMKAVIWKDFLWMWRNVPVMLFIIGLPVVQIILFCLTIGRDPKNLHLAYVNDELNFTTDCMPIEGCSYDLLSCQYLDSLRTRTIILDRFEFEEESLEAVQKGRAWGALYFSSNYSHSLKERLEEARYASELIVNDSNVIVQMDMSNQHIGHLLNRDLLMSFVDFAKKFLGACGINPKSANIPIRFEEPVYGDQIPDFTNFAAPGVILTIIFFLSLALTAGSMIMERKEGLQERCLVLGVTPPEILFSHVVTQFVVMALQTLMVLVFSFAVFDILCAGSLLWVIILTMLSGLCGMCFGFVVSSLCDTELTATYFAMGSFLPVLMLCGICWPVEGMHYTLKYVSFVLPLTFSTESLRAILARGWDISQPVVYHGFVATGVWIVVFLASSLMVLKFRKG
ncbi:ABC transporter G family member 23 [Cryptotermes secundus]|uniref:ABC transporter G family member 23 n=1 Tax=Cryptotermes secundus TaxID=105785 RepID=A0A2J7PYP8_9NEOP|nr:ABC transporter G family member 23 isoform X2 [Cryptotermes secundus]PNF21464.1 ABC transporter G family member 23 [Cryptotermes secundus]